MYLLKREVRNIPVKAILIVYIINSIRNQILVYCKIIRKIYTFITKTGNETFLIWFYCNLFQINFKMCEKTPYVYRIESYEYTINFHLKPKLINDRYSSLTSIYYLHISYLDSKSMFFRSYRKRSIIPEHLS